MMIHKCMPSFVGLCTLIVMITDILEGKNSTIYTIIVSRTNFLIVIGSPHAYFSHNQCAIMQMSNYRCLITGIQLLYNFL